ncbi:MAG: type II toxin-antitoxin system VapC family toxin [Kiritimatiellae bacterium]|nr:type II toxin-antitoxin system VapC family toxin [Kiritimatiellia bacterium]
MIYWDTCCVLKLFVQETDSHQWGDLAFSQETPLTISQLTRVEINFALCGKEARKEIKPGAAKALGSEFEQQIKAGFFHVTPLSDSIINRSIQLAHSLKTYPLRSLDGIHVATAIESGCNRIATTDQKFMKIFAKLGIRVVDV